MRNHFKIIVLLLVILTMMIVLSACTVASSDMQEDNKADTHALDNSKAAQTNTQPQSEPLTYDDSVEPQYFFICGSLLGSYDNNSWHSLCDTRGNYEAGAGDSATFYAKDLLNQDSYYVYEGKDLLGISKQVVWQTESTNDLGSFEEEEAPKKFAKYGKLYPLDGNIHTTSSRVFDLPVKLGDELSNLKIPNYSFFTEFVLDEEKEPDYSSSRLVTNSDVNLFPNTLTYGVEPTPEGTQSLLDLFKENNMENTIPNFSDCVLGDFDNDGKDEYLMIANTPIDKSDWPIIVGEGEKDKVGTFSAILYQEDDGSVQIIHNDMRPIPGMVKFTKGCMNISDIDYCHRIDLTSIADLNSDGSYEIIVSNILWEGGHSLAYSQNAQGNYTVIMRSNWGM